jgi:serine/threonine-protein kinase
MTRSAGSLPACATCGAALPEGAAACPRCLMEGGADVFAGLELEDELGRGGMGTVFRARHLKLGRTVAVKFLAPEMAQQQDVCARFEREARAMAMLSHPHVVQVFDFGTDEGEAYLVMEHVAGGPLSKRLPLAPKDAVRVAREVCAALAYAHGRGIVHRDIKPENVLLDEAGHAKVSDFGIARILSLKTQVTRTGIAVGSAGYMAPETLKGAEPTPLVDVFAVGALLREMLTGQPPVGELKELPMGLDTVVRRAMAQEPAERFPSMQAFADALERYLLPPTPLELPVDERLWMRATALVQTVSVAGVLWVGLLCLTPKVSNAEDVPPLVALGQKVLDGGKLYTRARFETVPVLVSLGILGLALAVTAFLRRHWRREGLDVPRPEAPLPQSRWVLIFGAGTLAIYALHHALDSQLAQRGSYVPVFGGLWLLAVWYFAAYAILEAQRVGRPLTKEPKVWAGLFLGLIPPVLDGLRQISERLQ